MLNLITDLIFKKMISRIFISFVHEKISKQLLGAQEGEKTQFKISHDLMTPNTIEKGDENRRNIKFIIKFFALFLFHRRSLAKR